MPWFFLAVAMISADLSAEQLALLKTFRSEFMEITPGQGQFPEVFVMGRDGGPAAPAHEVRLQGKFFIAKYEVPQNLYEAVMGKNPSRWKGPRNSVEMVSFDEAEEFCRKATEAMRAAGLIGPRQGLRLPSEAEWEYVARAGSITAYSFGDDPQKLGDYGWFHGNAAGNDPPVGAKKPNPWGLYDVHGYLWEWCADPWHADYRGAPTDGSVWTKDGDSTQAVLRGGSWKDGAEKLSSAFRQAAKRETRDDAIGFRCVLTAE
jgi:formylglycine-generating enzyme required for sulfatase activity